MWRHFGDAQRLAYVDFKQDGSLVGSVPSAADDCAQDTASVDRRASWKAPAAQTPRGAAALHLTHGLPPDDVRTRLVVAGRHSDVSHRVLAFHLAEAAECRHFLLWGYSSIEAFADIELGLSRRSTRDLVLAGERLEHLLEVDDAFASGKIRWSAVRELVKVVVPETELEWLTAATSVGQRRLEHMIATSRRGDRPHEKKMGLPNNKATIVLRLESLDRSKWENIRHAVAESLGSEQVSDSDLVQVLFERLQSAPRTGNAPVPHAVTLTVCPKCDAAQTTTDAGPETVDARSAFLARLHAETVHATGEGLVNRNEPPLAPGTPEDMDPPTPARLRHFIQNRDGHACICCAARANLQVHHIVWRSQGGKTNSSNLACVCARCHALIHDRILTISGSAPHGLTITRPHHATSSKLPLSAEWLKDITSMAKPDATLNSVKSASRREARSRNLASFDRLEGVARPVASLRRAADSAVRRGCPMPHTLLAGPAGLGKSSLARATAEYFGTTCHEVNATAFETVRELVDALRCLAPKDFLFLDEIQELKPRLMTALLSAMQDGKVTVPTDGRGGIPEHVNVEPFTVIAATTDPDRLTTALRSRFGSVEEMTRYTNEDLVKVLKSEASRQSLCLSEEVAERIANHAVGIPRTAIAFLAKTRDVAMSVESTTLKLEHLTVAEHEAGIDATGLGPQERALVATLTKFGSLARSKVACLIGMSVASVRDCLEPALIMKGMMTVTPRGLRLTRAASSQGLAQFGPRCGLG